MPCVRVVQAAGSWSVDACCAVAGNTCDTHSHPPQFCYDQTSSSNWLFGLWPGPPQRFEPTGADTYYQTVDADRWPVWGTNGPDLAIGYRGAEPTRPLMSPLLTWRYRP